MKKIVIMSILLLALYAKAQRPRIHAEATTGGTVTWTWDAPVGGVPAASYNFYQAAGACPASGIIAGTLSLGNVTVTTFVQSPIPAGTTCSWVTAVSGVGIEGLPSIPFQLNTEAPGAPSQPIPTLTEGAPSTITAPIAKPIAGNR